MVDDIKVLLRFAVLFIPFPIWFAMFEQISSRWTFQGTRMAGKIPGTNFIIYADMMHVRITSYYKNVCTLLLEQAVYVCIYIPGSQHAARSNFSTDMSTHYISFDVFVRYWNSCKEASHWWSFNVSSFCRYWISGAGRHGMYCIFLRFNFYIRKKLLVKYHNFGTVPPSYK